MIFTHNFPPHNSTLWNNRVVTLNRKSVLKSVTDLMDCNGVILSYTDFAEKYNLSYSQREYNKLCKLIPQPLIHLIENFMAMTTMTTEIWNICFFLYHLTQCFWSDIKKWISLKINDVPCFELYHIIFCTDKLALSVSDIIINIILLLGKYHIHCAKWRYCEPAFFLSVYKNRNKQICNILLF